MNSRQGKLDGAYIRGAYGILGAHSQGYYKRGPYKRQFAVPQPSYTTLAITKGHPSLI